MSSSIFKSDPKVSRRDFVKAAAAGAASLTIMGLPSGGSAAVQRYLHWGKAVVIRDDGATDGPNVNKTIVQEMLDEAIKTLTNGGGWESLFPSYQKGETVAIKVNCQWPRVATQPKVVSAIVNSLVGIGIPKNNIVIWDCEAEAMQYSAMYMVRMAFNGVRLMTTDKVGIDQSKSVDIQGDTIHLSRILTEASHLINVPVLKNHFEAGITFALKNHVGSAGKSVKDRQKFFHDPPEEGNRLHKALGRGRPIGERIALINATPDVKDKTRLIVGDALFGVYLRGPLGEPEFAYNGLIVGTDPVATDHQVRLIIEGERGKRQLPILPCSHIDHAIRLGLGAPVDQIQPITVNRTKKA